jgi:hypothetical protein
MVGPPPPLPLDWNERFFGGGCEVAAGVDADSFLLLLLFDISIQKRHRKRIDSQEVEPTIFFSKRLQHDLVCWPGVC